MGLVSALVAAAAMSVLVQDSDAERLKRIEEQVRKQQEEIDQLKKGPGDAAVDLHVSGRFQEHLRVLFDRPDASRTSPDTFYVRAARLKADGTLYRDFGFQVEGDFPSSATGPAPMLQGAFVEWRRHKEFKLLVGQFKAPMSQERLRSRLYGDFVEDSTLTRFVPGYDIGIQASGQAAEGLFEYQVAVVNGRSHLDNAGRSRHDDNDEKELVARISLTPGVGEKESFLRGLRLAVSGSITEVDDVPITGAGVATFDISTPELGVTFLDPATGAGTVFLDGRRSRAGAELSWACGPACLRAEVLIRSDEMVNGALKEDVRTRAWSLSLTWLVTGEEKSPDRRVIPGQPIDAAGGWGALEVAARVAGAEVGDEIEDVGVGLAGQTNGVTSTTFGVNWWLTHHLRISANVIHERYDDEVAFGGGRIEGALTGVLARIQVDF